MVRDTPADLADQIRDLAEERFLTNAGDDCFRIANGCCRV